MVEKRVKKFGQGPPPPPFSGSARKKKIFSQDGFPYVMATSFFYIYIYIYKLTERPVGLLNAIFVLSNMKKNKIWQIDAIYVLKHHIYIRIQ